MLAEILNKTYEKTTPIFADEILGLFPNYSKQYVYRLISKAVEEGKLSCYERGVYYIPQKTFFGYSSINADQVALKRYIRSGDDCYGLYVGLSLLNLFGITTQMPNGIEIVTNCEATRRRTVRISNRTYTLKKSRCKITKDNIASYTIFQLFLDMDDGDNLDDSSTELIKSYLNRNNISLKDLMEMSSFFPGKALKRMMRSGILYDVI